MMPGARVRFRAFPLVGLGTVQAGEPEFRDMPRVRVLWDVSGQVTEPALDVIEEAS